MLVAFRKDRELSPPAFPPPQGGREPAIYAVILCFILPIVSALPFTSAYAAGDIKAGRQKAMQCQACHGIDGLAKIPDAPNIAGSPEQYLARQLNAFRKGERKNEMMSVVAQQISEKDIDDLAAYYAAIEVTVTLPK
jgi:cytochrome c553